jgi:hypothetical protein
MPYQKASTLFFINPMESLLQFKEKPEVMKLPEINIHEERGLTLLSILLKGYNPDWGECKHKLSQEVKKFFEQNPLDEKASNFLKEIKVLEDNGVDEETLYNISLVYEHPERKSELLDFIHKHKDYINDPQQLKDSLISILQQLEATLPNQLKEQISAATANDIEQRNLIMHETKEKLKKIIDFFKPSPQTTANTKITILPTDFLYPKNSGGAFSFGKKTILRSHINNPDNLEHEFLHSIINPIIDKLSKRLSEEQKQKISQLGSYVRRIEEDYGEDFYSLLCEEFIRTYTDILQRNEKPATHDDFIQKINTLTEKKFTEILQVDDIIRNHCEQLKIETLQDLKDNSQEYFDSFKSNKLRDIVFNFYQKYILEKERDNKTTFEVFVLESFENEL